MKVKDLTMEQLKALIDEAVEDKLAEVLGWDPDRGLELSDEAKCKIEESLAALKRGEGVPLEEVAKEMGLDLE